MKISVLWVPQKHFFTKCMSVFLADYLYEPLKKKTTIDYSQIRKSQQTYQLGLNRCTPTPTNNLLPGGFVRPQAKNWWGERGRRLSRVWVS